MGSDNNRLGRIRWDYSSSSNHFPRPTRLEAAIFIDFYVQNNPIGLGYAAVGILQQSTNWRPRRTTEERIYNLNWLIRTPKGRCLPITGRPCHFQFVDDVIPLRLRRSCPCAEPLKSWLEAELKELENEAVIRKVLDPNEVYILSLSFRERKVEYTLVSVFANRIAASISRSSKREPRCRPSVLLHPK